MRHILIDKEIKDLKNCGYGFPWRHDSTCYNFRMPKEVVTPDEIDGIEDKSDIETLVIACDLPDYRFLEEMTGLRQLYIYSGANIYDLDFTRHLIHLRQLYVAESHVGSLEPLIELVQEKKSLYDLEKDVPKRLFISMEGICILSDKELDGTPLKKQGLYIGEVIINGKNSNGKNVRI